MNRESTVGAVRRLPDDLANQIAAGEVVERPASVVKELLENALDAQATRVRVDVEGGGLDLLRVADDGLGMEEPDARLAVERHATSKIGVLDDLLTLATFGFRGEALPSIASVSRFVLQSRRRDTNEGIEVRVEGGSAPILRPCGLAPGTTVEVRDLFFNVPARRKFLKAPGTEAAHISDVVEAIALGAPTLTITLARQGRVVREWLRADNATTRARASFVGEELAELHGERGSLSVLALLGRPERARASSAALKLFVNGRLVRDRVLVRTILQAYGSVLPPGRYPPGVVFLTVPPDRVDVNVHPQKAEVRFADGRAVADGLFQVLSLELGRAFGLAPQTHPYQNSPHRTLPASAAFGTSGLHGTSGVSGTSGASGTSVVSPLEEVRPDPWGLDGTVSSPDPLSSLPSPSSSAGAVPPSTETPAETLGVFGSLTFLAQLRTMFLVCEGPDGLYVLDQHAAAERVTFHRLKQAFLARRVAVQPLLFPTVVAVSAEEAALVEQDAELLLTSGMDLRRVGPTSVAVHGVPQLLRHAPAERLLRDLLAQVLHTATGAFQDAIDLALATMACHGSVRAGDRMAPEEVRELLVALDSVDFAGHCPHGRPIVTRLRWEDLERQVGRRG